MASAALASSFLTFLVYSVHCEVARQGQDGPNRPKPLVLGPYYTCKTDGRLQRVTRTGTQTGPKSVHWTTDIKFFAENSEEALKHCPKYEEWYDDEDEEW